MPPNYTSYTRPESNVHAPGYRFSRQFAGAPKAPQTRRLLWDGPAPLVGPPGPPALEGRRWRSAGAGRAAARLPFGPAVSARGTRGARVPFPKGQWDAAAKREGPYCGSERKCVGSATSPSLSPRARASSSRVGRGDREPATVTSLFLRRRGNWGFFETTFPPARRPILKDVNQKRRKCKGSSSAPSSFLSLDPFRSRSLVLGNTKSKTSF